MAKDILLSDDDTNIKSKMYGNRWTELKLLEEIAARFKTLDFSLNIYFSRAAKAPFGYEIEPLGIRVQIGSNVFDLEYKDFKIGRINIEWMRKPEKNRLHIIRYVYKYGILIHKAMPCIGTQYKKLMYEVCATWTDTIPIDDYTEIVV